MVTRRRGDLLILALLGILLGTAFGRGVRSPVQFDDVSIVRRHGTLTSWEGLARIPPFPRGVTAWCRGIVIRLWGIGPGLERTGGLHLFGFGVHLLVAWMIYLVARRFWDVPPTAAGFAAALFAVHPVQTQAAVYLSAQAELLAAAFLLGGLLATDIATARLHAGYRRGGLGWGGIALACGILALSSKESGAVALPLYLLWMLFGRGPLRNRTAVVVLVAVLLVGGIVTATWVRPHMQRYYRNHAGPDAALQRRWVGRYLMSQTGTVPTYVGKTLLPSRLSLEDDRPWTAFPGERIEFDRLKRPWGIRETSGTLFLLLWSGTAVIGLAKRRNWGFPTAWVPIAFLPASSIVPLTDLANEHRLYLPLVGVAWLVGMGGGRLLRITDAARGGPAVAAILLFYLAGSAARAGEWNDPRSLWRETVREVPAKPRALANRAQSHLQAGETERALHVLERAETALGTMPIFQSYRVWDNSARVHWAAGHREEGITRMRRALKEAGEGEHRGILGRRLCRWLMEVGRPEDAVIPYQVILSDLSLGTPPDATAIHETFLEWGIALRGAGRHEEGLEAVARATTGLPDDPRPSIERIGILLDLERFEEAIGSGEEAVRRFPGHGGILLPLAEAYHAAGKTEIALARTRTATERGRGGNPDLLLARARYASALGRTGEAIDAARRVLEFRPESEEARAILEQTGDE